MAVVRGEVEDGWGKRGEVRMGSGEIFCCGITSLLRARVFRCLGTTRKGRRCNAGIPGALQWLEEGQRAR